MAEIHNVHAREIAAPLEVVGEILDTLGSSEDRVWASDIWMAEPVVFDRPLGVGADGGHGLLRYSVVEYQPGRRVVFRFSPGGELSGSHGFEVEPVGPEHSRISHFLDVQISLWRRPLVPILIGWHDAMVETAFDRVELEATGSLQRRTRIPRWLRIANRTEIAIERARGKLPPRGGRARTRLPLGYRLFRPAAFLVPAALTALAALHAAWALGWRWPGHDAESLAERVVGAGAELPPEPLVWIVAGLLGAAAAVVAAVGSGRRERLLRGAAWSVAGVLLARGAAYIPIDLIGSLETEYARLDLVIYSPLSLALGLGAAIVARGPQPEYEAEPTRSRHGPEIDFSEAEMDGGPRMRLPETAHTSRPWRVHEFTGDFELEDVWELPTPGGRDDLARLVQQTARVGDGSEYPAVFRALFALRWKLGEMFGWDKPGSGVGERVRSLRERLPADLLEGPRGPDLRAVPGRTEDDGPPVFHSVYQTRDEWVAELANKTVHSLMHIGWVPDESGEGYHAQMAVLVKPNGWRGKAYMAAIKPFRYALVYPMLLRSIERQWQQGLA